MTDHSPEPSDPWAPPERPAADPGGRPADRPVPPVHEQPMMAGMPGVPPAAAPSAYPPPAPAPSAYPSPSPAPHPGYPQPPAPGPAYGYPAQPGPGAYAYPGGPVQPGHPGYPGYPGGPGVPGYPYPYAAPPASNGFGVASLVLGIISVMACATMIGPIALGIAAVVFGALGRGKAARGEATNGGVALAGLILGAVGIVLGIGMTLLVFVLPEVGDSDDGGDAPSSVSQVDTRARERV
ncbi:DUF4190 domain-containing protein [Streptomyces sp. NPDC031705]|uniref:DUF4190 domain-containing protein n=1 Tax=Streptomyces sp. NPDC031705 TaxID=3155729 RepID=UPI0033EBF511